MLDQLSRGLDTVGLMGIIKDFPQQCKQLFVQTTENAITATSVKEATLIFNGKNENEEKLEQLFQKFLDESSPEGT